MTTMTNQLAALSNLASHTAGLFERLRLRWATAGQTPLGDTPSDAAEEAASVRAMADRYRRSDPGFASDLYAAAERHERAAEAAAGR